jgi:tRNA pseudouridine13 synthase
MLSDFERAPGVIKSDYIDFQVEELPLYSFSGQGDHTYFLVEKAGLGTMQAVNDLADALNIRRVDIGYAGLKDARAITRQWMSVEHIAPEKIKALNIPRMAILDVTRHSNKLKLGHLRGKPLYHPCARHFARTPGRVAGRHGYPGQTWSAQLLR